MPSPLRFSFVLLSLIGAFCVPCIRAQDASPAEPTVKPWRKWLASIAPKSPSLPEVPSPLRDATRVWTENEVLARALQANPEVQIALVNVQRADAVRLSSVSALLPKIGLLGSWDWRAEGLIDRSESEQSGVAVGRALTPVSRRGYNYQLQLSQNLFDGLASWNQVKRMALLQQKASVDARELYLRVAAQVRQAFDIVLWRQTAVGIRRDAVRDLTRLADVAQRRYSAGVIGEIDSIRAQTALRAAEAELAQAEADWAQAQEQFCRMIYIERPPEGVRLAGVLQPREYTGDFQTALERARLGRLDLRSAELQVEAARKAQQIAAAGWLPQVEAVVSYGWRSSYYDVHRENSGWSGGLVARWNIFDGGQTVASSRVQRADRRIAEMRLADTRGQIPSQLRELFAGLEQSKTVLQAHIATRSFAERGVREANRLYEVGQIGLEHVLNFDGSYREAQLRWLGAVYNNNATIYRLDYASANESFLDAVAPAQR